MASKSTGTPQSMGKDVVAQIRSFNAGRDPQRLAMKYLALRASPFAFLRGTCHRFYDRLPRRDIFETAPPVWVVGDLHLQNFGSYKGDNRLAYFDINDFDEAVLVPASWDLVRFLTSLRVAADEMSLGEGHAHTLCQRFVDSYALALTTGKAYWVERDSAQGLVRQLLDGLRERQRAKFLDTRTTLHRKRRVLRVDGSKALPATDAQRKTVGDFMQGFARSQPDPDFYTVLDVARRIAGTGSLGVDRYVVLVEGKGSPDGNYLLDLKQALPSSLLPRLQVPQPKWKSEAHRVVALQRRLQAVSMAFLHPVFVDEVPFVLRALQPSEDRIALNRPRRSVAEIEQVIVTMASLLAWAQLRSAGRDGSAIADELIAFARRKKWKLQLLDASEDCAARLHKDWASFSLAYDEGAFNTASAAKDPV